MKYRVVVKEIWQQSYLVEAKSKAHAKTLVEQSYQRSIPQVSKQQRIAQRWGLLSNETWEVVEL